MSAMRPNGAAPNMTTSKPVNSRSSSNIRRLYPRGAVSRYVDLPVTEAIEN
jgi:hypothetical protein